MDPTQTQTPQTTTSSLDPGAVNVAKSIRQVESNGNFSAKGASGEYGAYQWLPSTWSNMASQAGLGGVDLKDATASQQNQVAYTQIKKWKDEGYNVGQIASMWNAGAGAPNAYQDNNVGTNKEGVSYNTPAYAEKVAKAYQSFKAQSGGQSSQGTNNGLGGFDPNSSATPTAGLGGFSSQLQTPTIQGSPTDTSTTPTPQTPQEPGLGQELAGRLNDAGTAIQNATTGKINPLSGLIQTAGAATGAVGDVVNKGLELIPGFKGLENLLGQGVGAVANSSVGKPIANAIQSFSAAHPELSDDIGAGFNIATAIPIFEGLGAVKDLAMGSVSDALQNVAKKATVDGVTDSMSVGKVLPKYFAKYGGKDVVQNAVDTLGKDAVPKIVGKTYVTDDAFHATGDAISKIEDEQLQPLLKKASTNKVADRIPLATYKQQAMDDAVSQLKSTTPVENYFDRIQAKYGDFPSLEQMNQAKRTVANNITEAGFNSPTYSTDKVVRDALQKAVEDGANGMKLGDVAAINDKMGNLIKYQNMLEKLNGTTAKIGKIRGLVQRTAGLAAGIGVGGMIPGGGIAAEAGGGYVGEQVANAIGKRSIGGIKGSFLQGAEGLVNPALKTTGKKIAGLVAATAVQRANR
jgi:muramidase (phage lysozyme)